LKLSVIVPSLTGEVPASVRALVDQVELVVVNGISPVAEARNVGLARATGDYLAWVDADDEIADTWLASVRRALASAPDIVTFDVRTEWHDGSGRAPYGQRHCTADFSRDYLRGRLPGQLWCKVMKAELFRGRRFAGSCYEDTRMLCDILQDARRKGCRLKVVDVPETLYVYRRRADGLSQLRRTWPTMVSLLRLTVRCRSSDMLVGMLRLWWDFAKSPARRLLSWRLSCAFGII